MALDLPTTSESSKGGKDELVFAQIEAREFEALFALLFEQVGRRRCPGKHLDLFAGRLRWFVAETEAMEIDLVHQLEAIVHKEMGVSCVVALDELHGQSSLPVQPLLKAIPLAVGLRVKEIAKNVEFACGWCRSTSRLSWSSSSCASAREP